MSVEQEPLNAAVKQYTGEIEEAPTVASHADAAIAHLDEMIELLIVVAQEYLKNLKIYETRDTIDQIEELEELREKLQQWTD